MTGESMRVRLDDDTWLEVGTGEQPLRVRMSDATWKIYGGGGGTPLRARKDDTWLSSVSSGMSGWIIYGFVKEFSTETPLVNKYVRSGSVYTFTDEDGFYVLKNINLYATELLVYRATPYSNTVSISGYDTFQHSFTNTYSSNDLQKIGINYSLNPINIIFDQDNPIQRVDIFFPDGIYPAEYTLITTYDRPLIPPPITRSRFESFDNITDGEYAGPKEGWFSQHRTILGWHDPYDNPYGLDRPTGTVSTEGATNSLTARTVSAVTKADSFDSSQKSYIEERVGWYSVPVGMFLEDAKTDYELNHINNPSGWAGNAEIYTIQVVHRLRGWSAKWDETDFVYPDTSNYIGTYETAELYSGVGALRYQGPTPQDITVTSLWQRKIPYSVNARLYTVPVVRGKEFAREEGDIIWTGDLNDLGDMWWASPYDKPVLEITQTFSPDEFSGPQDALQYHAQTSPLPDPPSFSEAGTDGVIIFNEMEVWWTVRIIYRYW